MIVGSQVRGASTRDSDWDVLVIEEVAHPRRRSVDIQRALRGLLVPIDVIVATPQQIARYGKSPALIYQAALQEGEVLYERPSRT